MAVASITLGLLGVTIGLCLWFLPVMPVLAVIFGHISLSKIRMTGLPGRGLAITGLVTGYVGIGLSVIIYIVSIIGAFSAPSPTF